MESNQFWKEFGVVKKVVLTSSEKMKQDISYTGAISVISVVITTNKMVDRVISFNRDFEGLECAKKTFRELINVYVEGSEEWIEHDFNTAWNSRFVDFRTGTICVCL